MLEKNKRFIVDFTYEEAGQLFISATSEKEALEVVEQARNPLVPVKITSIREVSKDEMEELLSSRDRNKFGYEDEKMDADYRPRLN